MNVGGGSSSSSSHPLAPFTPLRKLGAGGFGSVFLVRDSRDGIQYVMKEVELTKLDAKGRRDAMKEVKFLARMSHPNIIGYKEWFQLASPPIMQHYVGPSAGRGMRWPPPLPVSNAPSRPGTTCTLYIVMTYADGGDLESRIKAQQALSGSARHGGRFVPFPEQQIIDWFIQTALAIKHVHDRKILHRDIKTQNIFLTKLQLVKLGDFGIARDLSNTLAKAMTQIGTPFYLSPEICNEQPYDAKSDMWALGVVLYELLTLRHPFSGSTMKQLLSNIVQARYPPVPALYSKPLVELVGYLLQKNPKNRPSINQLLRMPFIQTHIGRFLNAHQIQEEFSHSILHGPSSNHAALQQGAAARRAPPASAGAARPSADAKAHALAAQQQQQQQQQQAAAAAAALAAKEAADRVVREQQQREQQAREAARQAAIHKAKQQALEAAERARAQQRELIHKQQMAQAAARARLEAAHAEKQRKEREELERLRQAREAIQKERQQRFEKAQADRQEAARRAEERAKQVAAEREEDRRRDKEARDLRRAAAQVAGAGAGAAGGGGGGGWDAPCVVVAAPKRGRQQPPRSSMDNRPPWVGVMDESEIEAAKRVADEQAEEQRRKRELEAEQRGHAPNYHHPPQRASYDPSIAPTIVRPRPPSFHRQLQMEQQQQQQQQQQQHQQHQHGGHHPAQRRAASVADLAPAHADRNGHAAGAAAAGGSHNRQLSKAEAQRLHEEKLAQARKEYFEERKRLERMQRERVQAELGGASGAGSEGTSSAAPDNRASSLPAAAPAPHRPSPLQRTQSEATFDRPHAPHQRQPTPSTSRSSSSSSSHAPSSKAEAQAAKEAELARIRQEYFLERKALAERKKRMLMMEENGLNDATQASPAQSPIADQPASRSRSPLALHDRTPRAPAQRTVRESILSSSPEVTALLSDGEQADHDQALEMGSSTVRHVPRGSGDDFEVVHAQPSAPASPRDDPEVDGVEGEDESEEDESEAEAEMVSIDPEFAASEAEATIDELARSNESCLEMIQLMQTMRHAHAMSTSLSGKKKQQEKDGQEANGADDQIPVQTVIHQPSRDHDQDGDEYVEEEADDDSMSEVHEDEEEEYQIPLARSDDDVDEEGEQEGEGDEEEEEEESALAEYTAVFQSQHVREAAAIARRQLAEEEEERRVRQNTTTNSKPNSIDDHPQEEHAVLSPPSGQTILYNSSATPSAVHRDESRPPTTAATNTAAPSTAASPALSSRSTISTASSVSSSSTSSSSSSSSNPTPSRNGSDQSSASSRSSSGAASSSSISFAECADPLSYKVESLRLFLGQKIGDTLLMQIWDLLRAKLSSPSTSVAGGDDGLAQSPLQISVHVENAHVATLPSSAAASTGVAPRSRSSMTSLIINGMNVRALLTESGLLSAGGNHSKYLSLIQQLIQAEYELYGQL